MTSQNNDTDNFFGNDALAEDFFASLSVGVCVIDDQGVIVKVNQAFCDLLSAENSELVGLDYTDLLAADEVADSLANFSEIITGRQTRIDNVMRKIPARSGEMRHVKIRVSRVVDQAGKTFLTACIEDVTDAHNLEQKIKRQEDQFASVLSAIPDVLMIFDAQGNFHYVFTSEPKLLARPVEEMLGKNVADILPADTASRIISTIQRTLTTGKTQKIEYVIESQDKPCWFSASSVVLDSESGPCVLWIARDLTQLLQAQTEIQSNLRFMNSLLGAIPDPVYYKDISGRYIGCNKAFERITGKTIREIRGKTARDIWPAENAKFYEKMDAKLIQSPGTQFYEDIVLNVMGKPRNMIFSKATFYDASGEVAGLIGALTDITEHKRAVEALKESERRYRTVADHTHDWEYWVSPDGEYNYISPACLDITGYTSGEFISNPELLFDIVYPADRDLFTSHYVLPLSELKTQVSQFDFRIVTKAGQIRWITHNSRPVFDEKDNWLGRRGCNRDITERHKIEQERETLQLKMLQAQKLESLGVLAGGVAHDFNNLLVGILGNAELALGEIPPGMPGHDLISNVQESAIKAAELTNQMLAYSGQGHFIVQPADLGEIVREMAQLLESSILSNTKLLFDLAPGLPKIQADVSQIQQVVVNLVTNAAEAIGQESGEIRVATSQIFASKKLIKSAKLGADLPIGNYVCLSVCDTGHGMNSETLEKLFEPFFSTKFTGRGLGLAATHGIVRGHKGAILVESTENQGSCFKILFPACD